MLLEAGRVREFVTAAAWNFYCIFATYLIADDAHVGRGGRSWVWLNVHAYQAPDERTPREKVTRSTRQASAGVW